MSQPLGAARALAAAETRERILAAAEDHFRQYGYAKTGMADIAKVAGMSPANIYRFFDGKVAIILAIADLWLGQVEAVARAVAARRAPPEEKLLAYVVEVHEKTRERYLNQGRCHELVVMVTEQHHDVVEAHKERMAAILAVILEEGMDQGAFARTDPLLTAHLLRAAMAIFHHPLMVAEHAHHGSQSAIALPLFQMILAGLRGRH